MPLKRRHLSRDLNEEKEETIQGKSFPGSKDPEAQESLMYSRSNRNTYIAGAICVRRTMVDNDVKQMVRRQIMWALQGRSKDLGVRGSY